MTQPSSLLESPAIVPHLGELLRRMRQARELSQADIARVCAVHRSTILNFEQRGALFRDRITYARYVQSLADASIGCPDLQIDPSRRALLDDLFTHAQPAGVRADEERLAAIDFVATQRGDTPALRRLINQLRAQPLPGAIIDDLGFVHVLNGALLRMFDITPDLPYLQRWEAWHVFATKLVRDSPVHHAYTTVHGNDLFFIAALYQFFERMRTLRYLFTRQMQTLNWRLAVLAHQEGYLQHTAGWRLISAFQVVPGMDGVLRIVRFQNEILTVQIIPGHPCQVSLPGSGMVTYHPITWHPLGANAARVMAACRDQRLFFAAEYDRHERFHVNTWSELQDGAAGRLRRAAQSEGDRQAGIRHHPGSSAAGHSRDGLSRVEW